MTSYELSLIGEYQSSLMEEFYAQEYESDRFFFPDSISERQAKYMLWLMKKYGVEDKFMQEVEQFELLILLKKK